MSAPPRARTPLDDEHGQDMQPRDVSPPRKSRPPTRRSRPVPVRWRALLDGTGRRDCVELVRVEEHRRLGRARGVGRDGTRRRAEARHAPRRRARRPALDQPQAEMDVTEIGPRRGPESRPRPSSRTRPTSCRSAAASTRSERSRGCSCAVSSRASRRRPCAGEPPAYELCVSAAAARAALPTAWSSRKPPTTPASPWWAISPARNSRNRRARPRPAAAAAPARPDRHPQPRPSGSRAAAGRRSARRGRGREPRRPRQSDRRAARRRSRSGLRSGRWGRRARARGTERLSASCGAACARPRRHLRPCGRVRARRSCSSAESRAQKKKNGPPMAVSALPRAALRRAWPADRDLVARRSDLDELEGAAGRAAQLRALTLPVRREAARAETWALRALVEEPPGSGRSSRTTSPDGSRATRLGSRVAEVERRARRCCRTRHHAGPRGPLRLLRATRAIEPIFLLMTGRPACRRREPT